MYKLVCQCHCTRGEPKLEARRLGVLSPSVKERVETKMNSGMSVQTDRQTDRQLEQLES